MKPNDIPQWVMNNAMEAVAIAQGSEIEVATEIIAHALLNTYQRGKDEKQLEIDRLNKVIERMQKTMSSQAEQWTRSMAAARLEGMEEAAEIAKSAQLVRAEGTVGGVIEQTRHNIATTIRTKAQEKSPTTFSHRLGE